jgi:hypothetical protein
MARPENLRRLAERMLAMAVITEHRTLAQMLTKRAADHLDEAMALEAGGHCNRTIPRRKNKINVAGLHTLKPRSADPDGARDHFPGCHSRDR